MGAKIDQDIKITKYINDNIYGGIGLTDSEFKLVNTRSFQRLRRIKQQGCNGQAIL